MFSEKVLGPCPKRQPPIGAVYRIAILNSFIKRYRHNGEFLVGLNDDLFCHKESLRILHVNCRVIKRGAKVAGSAFTVLNAELGVAVLPFQTLMREPEGVTGGSWNCYPLLYIASALRCCTSALLGSANALLVSATLCVCIIEPEGNLTQWRLDIVDPGVDITF